MKPITFELFKYKFLVDDERIRFMYGEKQISEAYFADVLAATIIGKTDFEYLLHKILHIPEYIRINALPPRCGLFIAGLDDLTKEMKSKGMSNNAIDKIIAISKIGRNYMVDYSGLYENSSRLFKSSWNVKAVRTNDICEYWNIEKLNISIDGNKETMDVLLHVYSMLFYIHISENNTDEFITYMPYIKRISIALAIYYILKTTKHSINKKISFVYTEKMLEIPQLSNSTSKAMLTSFIKHFADEIPTNIVVKDWTYGENYMFIKPQNLRLDKIRIGKEAIYEANNI